MTRGLLHLTPVPNLTKGRPFERLLKRCVRNAAGVNNDRNTAIEDVFFTYISYYDMQDSFLIRLANIGSDGQPTNLLHYSMFDTLYEETVRILKLNYRVLDSDDMEYPTFYNAAKFDDLVKEPDFLFVPNKDDYVRTIVAIKSRSKKG